MLGKVVVMQIKIVNGVFPVEEQDMVIMSGQEGVAHQEEMAIRMDSQVVHILKEETR